MSGHSKWHNIRVRKMASDARKGKTYTKYARLIEIAAREGGGDPVKNAKLRSLIETAKGESVPNANIERAVKKGTGELKGDAMQEVTYEAYGPAGSAFIIECLTDNRNRTLSNVKLILSKNGGRFAESGSVLWMFERKGVVSAEKTDTAATGEELELALIEAGADDFSSGDGHLRVITSVSAWPAVRDLLAARGYTVSSAGLEYVSKQDAPADAVAMENVGKLMEALEEDEDVSAVHTNAIHEG